MYQDATRDQATPGPQAAIPARHLAAVERICVPLIAIYAVLLVGGALTGAWLVDPQHRPIATDFVNVFAAGKLVLAGTPALAYDWAAHRAVEVEAMGRAFGGYFGWHYPPPYLFAAGALALIPYAPGLVAWGLATMLLYAASIRDIVGHRIGLVLALAFPATLWNFATGQNGFLTAALFGGALAALPARPVLAGICFGLLTYKPHFGVLVPVALVAGGQWRAILAAALTALALQGAALLAFGPETFAAFWHSISQTNQAVFAEARANLDKMQSIFGLLRAFAVSARSAWIAQGVVIAVCAFATGLVWRGDQPYRIKAASLLALSLLATPYAYIYDATLLATAIAFPLAHWLERGLDRAQATALLCASFLVLTFPAWGKPTGLMATLLIVALLWREARRGRGGLA